jgi:hypothetical protein
MSLPTTEWEQRSVYYRDIEDLIRPGFLSHSFSVKGVRLAMRSPCPSDAFMIRARAQFDLKRNYRSLDWKIWTLATCTWLIDGYSVLGETNHAVALYEVYRTLPKGMIEHLFCIYTGLYNRMMTALKAVESYSLEDISRRRWKSLHGSSPSDESYSGVRGTRFIGMNLAQELWVALNTYEDMRLDGLNNWYQRRAAMAPHLTKKSWEHLTSKDKSDARNLREDRDQIKDLFYYRSMGVIGWKEEVSTVKDALILKRKTTKDLQREMYQWVAGEKDEHDLAIDRYKENIRKRYLKQQEEIQRKAELANQLRENDSGLTTSSKLVAFTPEQVNEMMNNSSKRAGLRVEYQESHLDKFYSLVKEEPTQGNLSVEEGELKVRQAKSLQDQISSRMPRFNQ